jgi:dephospho-CoA kinase
MLIIGITGTNASGKGTVVEVLKKEFGFKHLSVREYIEKEVKKRNLEISRETLIEVANNIRKNNSPSHIVEELYKKALKMNTPVVIESIRTVGEVESLKKKKSFVLMAVDANRKIRYKRALKRNSNTDNLTYEEFVKTEEKEMHSNDKCKQNIRRCIEMADILIINDNRIEDLEIKVREFVSLKLLN